MGLTWGCTPKEALEVLTKRGLKLTEEDKRDSGASIEQTYSGQFADLDTALIALDYSPKEGLAGLSVVFPSADDRPASKRWEDLVEKMRGSYGEPDTINAPPKTSGEALAQAYPETKNKGRILSLMGAMAPGRGEQLDRLIASGEWQPKADWRFANVVVFITVMTDRDKHGTRELRPAWSFMERRGFAMLGSVPKDF